MARSLLQLVQAACNEVGLAAPAFLFGNTDQQAAQLLALAGREASECASKPSPDGGGWTALKKLFTFNFVTAGPYTGSITSGSNQITNLSSTAGLVVGWGVSGSGIPASAMITAISGTTVTINVPATSTNASLSINFGQLVYPLPSDYAWMIPQTIWDANFRWQLMGPLEPQEWNVLQYGISPVGPRVRFKIEGTNVLINPVPGTGQTDLVALNYISANWCQSAAGAPQSIFKADTDTYLLNEDALIMGLKWRVRRAKGFDYQQERNDYSRLIDRLMARDGGSRSLPLYSSASPDGSNLLGANNVPDTGFGQ